ncbi:hypothetical protein RQP54_17890 [Curvibacter sp. APW13]|uniref:hypothetical protein n=1 Tax=Curvibacter sp. APW13 TaxID=3077236 RepID=UPI0028DED0CF|nr:hypothetical protein [Curvibacter sp. APW13]MDT8992749.1 hypothetical protein [Curvibacter sp. APW13]
MQTIYDLAFFALPGEGLVMAALLGTSPRKVRGALVRRWTCLAFGDEKAILREACRLAALLEEGKLTYKPKPHIAAESLIGLVRKKMECPASTGTAYDSANKPRICGFCIRVQRDAMRAWQAQDPQRAQLYLSHGPVERQPYEHVVLEKRFPATMDGYLSWLECLTPETFMEKFPMVEGGGEH